MENKKQLLIIPPMSEPLQKLKEVLDGIATDENIEISIIDDLKELMQFVGSSGQCLIAFSNAKKCATFLQENRFLIAKTHSKVILLTPKEIPAKTLIKFTKIGLTESILENSPPKTLLYKVKLLLRSIKSSGGSEEKELAVKSIDAAAKEAQAKGEINSDKLQTEESSVNYLAEERAKFKKSGDSESDESVNDMDNLKGKTAAQEESIETHWKSKRKKDDALTSEEESDVSKVETEDSAEIDMYYRGKKKSNDLDVIATDEIKPRKKLDSGEEEPDYEKTKSNSMDLDLAPADPEKKKRFDQEEEADYRLKKTHQDDLAEEEEVEPSRPLVSEAEEEERKRQEMMELDALFEEAKKRQKESEAEDLGGHYKGKIGQSTMDLDEPEETQEREDYDNSDLYSKEKSKDLDLAPAEEEKRRRMQEEEEAETKDRDGYGEKIGGNLETEEGQTDHIETLMKSDMGQDRSKNIKTHDIQERERKKNQEEDNSLDESKELDMDLAPEKFESKRKKADTTEETGEEENARDLDLASGSSEARKKEKLQDEEGRERDKTSQTKLKLLDGERDDDRKPMREEEDRMSYRKLDSTDLEPEQQKEKSSSGKSDKIDTFYRGGDAKKKDHDWDLDEKKNNLDLGLDKKSKRAPDGTQKKESGDLGEQTIDYRKMKEEFDAIARGEDVEGDGFGSGGPAGRKSDESEDGSFKVVELEAAGFDFAIEILNMIYQKELKPEEFYKVISLELQKSYHAYPVFYSYKPSDKKHTEIFDSILKVSQSDDIGLWWMEHKKDETIWADVQTKTMATWVCREMNWEDVELPTWASNELTHKKVELIYPYFDGVDRMGLAVVYFPEGINPKQARGIEVTLEMARTLLLDTIQRKSSPPPRDEEKTEDDQQSAGDKKNILSVFSGLFKGKKAG